MNKAEQIEQMRRYVSDAYVSARWKERVEHMHDNQIIAVYNSLKVQGKVS